MKKLFIILITGCLLLSSCGGADSDSTAAETTDIAEETVPETEPEETIMYYVTTPYGEEENRIGSYESLDTAKKQADDMVRFGYVVYDSKGEAVYCPAGSMNASKILYHAKDIADYMRDNNYTYGHAQINPAISKGDRRCERLASCDRFVGWALYEAGFSEGQPEKHGLMADLCPFLRKNGFTEITDKDELLPGDIVYVGYKGQPEPYGHVFIYAGEASRRTDYRYDAGSADRIKCAGQYASYHELGQPFNQPLELSSTALFCIAYRAPADK